MNLFVYTTHRLLEIERNFYLFIFDFHGEPPMLEESYEFGNQRNFLYDRISKKIQFIFGSMHNSSRTQHRISLSIEEKPSMIIK